MSSFERTIKRKILRYRLKPMPKVKKAHPGGTKATNRKKARRR
jgi:hypothetical protein